MIAERVEQPVVSAETHRTTFFRQSGWLMLANIAGGILTWAVHPLAKATGPKEYGTFIAFLSVAGLSTGVGSALQMVLAHQTAQALATNRQRELAGVIRLFWLGTFVLWLAGALVALAAQGRILASWHVNNPAAVWITLPIVLFTLWLPVFSGVLQGQQNLLWLGWTMMLNGVGRLLVAALAVLALGGLAAGMLTGVLLGWVLAVGIALWQTRALWLAPAQSFDWRSLLRQVAPLMLGAAAVQFLFMADTMFVKSYFAEEEVGFYGSAGTLSRALMWFVGPLAAVMFPRIVHSTARSEKSDLMGLVLVGTAILAVMGAVGLSVLCPWIIKLLYNQSWVKVAAGVLPWYAGAMVPLALANVLVNNLLARSDFRPVPALCVLAAAYGFALTRFHDSLAMVLQTLGVFNLLMLGVCAWFTWGVKAPSPKP